MNGSEKYLSPKPPTCKTQWPNFRCRAPGEISNDGSIKAACIRQRGHLRNIHSTRWNVIPQPKIDLRFFISSLLVQSLILAISYWRYLVEQGPFEVFGPPISTV